MYIYICIYYTRIIICKHTHTHTYAYEYTHAYTHIYKPTYIITLRPEPSTL